MSARDAIAERQERKRAAFEAAKPKAPRGPAAGAKSKEDTSGALPEKAADGPAGG